MPREYLSNAQAARLLNVSQVTLTRWIRQGLFHCPDASGQRIDRRELLRWAREHDIAYDAQPPEVAKPALDMLADAVERGAVTLGRGLEVAAEAIELAVNAVPDLEPEQRAELLSEVLERERMASTGLGQGVALPHPRKPPAGLVQAPVVSVCFPEHPLDWAALDGEPVFAVVLLLSPNSAVHLQLLTRIAFVLREAEFREFLHGRPSHQALIGYLRSISKDS
jgi:nitrogen PTS system EIIA component